MDQTAIFYDQLADDYNLIFGDWDRAVKIQGKNLHKLLKSLGFGILSSVLDCTCGTGLQSIGIALCGYKVHAADLSPRSIYLARKKAKEFNVSIKFQVADIRRLEMTITSQYNVVMAFGSLPHLLTKADLSRGIGSVYRHLRPGGLFMASIRDYDLLLENKLKVLPPVLYEDGRKYQVGLELMKWQKRKPIYELDFIHLIKKDNAWKTISRKTKFRAYRRDELTNDFVQEGFVNIKWLMPEETGYFQPIVTARKM